MLLSRYGFGNAAELAFTYSSTGKPALQGHNIHFSVSHSEGLAVYALSATGPVGVDVEKIRPVGEMQGIVDRYFPAQARAAFQSAPESERTEAFFRLWTRREAVLKAIGIGIPGLDEQIDESLCMVLELNVDQGYHAALAHEKSPPMKIVQREVPLGWSAGFVFLPDAHG
jgi:4'-phosphopantetheinyl transferase